MKLTEWDKLYKNTMVEIEDDVALLFTAEVSPSFSSLSSFSLRLLT